MTDALRSLAAELDELGREGACPHAPPEIPDFQLTDVLGRGGMGTVYLAEQLSLGREVALKVVNSSVATSAPLPTEARTVAQLHHPNIVQVYAAGTAQDQSWFAMELMRGKTANHSLFASAEDVARLGVQIAEALSYAHHCGVIHRDVKPSNIFIGENGMAKLGDFGLAAVATSAALPRGGTRRYMAPELLDGCKATEASDQYALGVALRELAPGGDADFAAICARATAPNPARRYADMDAMLDDLRRFLVHRPVAANPPSLATAPAMKIGGSDSINSILSGHWRKFAEEIRISPTALRVRIKQLCTAISTHTCKTLNLPDECDAVLEIIKDRAKKLGEV